MTDLLESFTPGLPEKALAAADAPARRVWRHARVATLADARGWAKVRDISEILMRDISEIKSFTAPFVRFPRRTLTLTPRTIIPNIKVYKEIKLPYTYLLSISK